MSDQVGHAETMCHYTKIDSASADQQFENPAERSTGDSGFGPFLETRGQSAEQLMSILFLVA